jgi:hypothetical protein
MDAQQSDSAKGISAGPSLLIPVALVVLASFVWAGFQTIQLVRERETLRTIRANQENPVQEATKLRTQLDSIARGTAELANQGNPNAKTIISELQKRGITVNLNNPPAPATSQPTQPTK